MTPVFDFAERMGRARGEMSVVGVDALLLSLGRDLPYLTGYEAPHTERLTMLVVRADGEATLVVPELEEPRVVPQPDVFAIRPWGETDDPVALVADLAGSAEAVAIGDQTWAYFLLALEECLPSAAFTSAAPISSALRLHKSADEIELLRAAGAGADRVAGRLAGTRFSGRSEADLSQAVGAMLLEEGHDTAGFAIVASGPNGASPHHDPAHRVISPGDAVVVDFGGSVGGYQSDTTRTFYVGEPTAEMMEVHGVVAAAQEAGFRAATVARPAQEVDRAARSIIEQAGYGEFFIHRTGHGIGLDVHEDPYLVEGNSGQLTPGMAFSVEPGIYQPGRFGVRIEDIVVLLEDGPKRLNESERGPVIVA
jgi:D-alanyl-D-alanine dipeptidase